MELAIKLNDIQKSFGEDQVITQVLFDINLEVYSKDLSMIVGPSGCGKTTLINLIGGILNPDKGSINVFGEEITKLGDDQKTIFRRNNIGFIFQQFNLIPTLNVLENITVPLLINKYSFAKSSELALDIIEKVELSKRVNYFPRQLSGGEQQRVAIARALITNPRLIICDEPTASLDSKTGKAIVEILKQTAINDNKVVIVVTHDTRIFKYADRIIKMDDGRIKSAKRVHQEGKNEA